MQRTNCLSSFMNEEGCGLGDEDDRHNGDWGGVDDEPMLENGSGGCLDPFSLGVLAEVVL